MYKTVFDATEFKIDFMNGLIPMYFLFFIIGTGLIIYYKYFAFFSEKKAKGLIFGWFFVLFSGLLLLVFLVPQFLTPQKAKRLLKANKFKIVEGKPINFHTIPPHGNGSEHFYMQGVYFEYSDYHPGFGYHNASTLGGVIDSDNYYRITYATNPDLEEGENHTIIKIEIFR